MCVYIYTRIVRQLVGVPHHRHGIVFPGLVDLEHGKPAKVCPRVVLNVL